MPTDAKMEHVKLILSKTRPSQSIGNKKLYAAVKAEIPSIDAFYAALRHLRREGLAKSSMRHMHPEGSLITFFEKPLPVDKRDVVDRASPTPAGGNEVFSVERTFNVAGGVYTARQLEKLARAVLRELER